MSSKLIAILGGCALGLAVSCSRCDGEQPATESASTASPSQQTAQLPTQPPDAPGDAKPTAAPSERPAPHDPAMRTKPAAPGRVAITGVVNGGLGKPARVDVNEVCIHGHDDIPCVKTDNVGFFRIEAPERSDIALLFRGDELRPTLRAFSTTSEAIDIGNTRVANESGLSRIAEAMGQTEQSDRGALFFAGVPGTSATLEPASGTRFFLGYNNELLEEEQAVVVRGTAGFFNVMPGRTAIRFAHPDGPCTFSPHGMSGWPDPADPGVAIVPVLAGHITHTTAMNCSPPKSTEPAAKSTTKPAATRP